jgi:hypothetical protein
MLMAYSDGELDQKRRSDVEAYLAQSTHGAERLAVFATTGRSLADLFEQAVVEPIPQRLLDTVRGTNAATAVDTSNVIPFGRKATVTTAPGQRNYVWLAAACVSLAIAGAGAEFALRQGSTGADGAFGLATTSSGQLVAGQELAAALETTPGGESNLRELAALQATLKPVFTFASAAGGYCRQYEIARGQGSSFAGVACRDAAAQWQIKTQVAFVPKPAAKKPGHSQPAAGPESEAIDAIVQTLISGDVLGGEAEAALMKSGWTTTKP